VALALGVALIAATGLVLAANSQETRPSRFGDDVVVVTSDTRLRPPDAGNPDADGVVLAAPPGLQPSTVEDLATLPGVGRAVVDHTVDLALLDAPALDETVPRGHGWSSTTFGPYHLVAGRAPVGDTEAVVDGRLAGRDRVRVATPAGIETFRVVGVTGPADTTELVVFFTDTVAARLAGRVDAVVLLPQPGTGADALAESVRGAHPDLPVLTGPAVRLAEPDPRAWAYEEAGTLLGMMAGISAFVTIFVVAGTFALAVAQRRRELALLRLVGATPRQVRRMVVAEAALLGVAATLAGLALAAPVGHVMVALLRTLDVGPARLTLTFNPLALIVASLIGMVVALLGVWVASRRTRRVRPVEALRDAAVERRRMTASRWFIGVVFLGGGVALLWAMANTQGDGRLSIALLVGQVLVIGAAALAPVFVPGLVGLVVRPLLRLGDVTVEVARANLRSQARRTAGVAAPVLVMVGLAGSLITATSTLEASSASELDAQTTAEVVVVPTAGPGLTDAAVSSLRAPRSGVAGVAPVGRAHVHLVSPGGIETITATVLPPRPEATGAVRYTVRSGSMADLHGDAVAATVDMAGSRGWRVGDEVALHLDDGNPARLRLVAIVDGGISVPWLVLPADRVAGHTAAWSTPYALVALAPGADATGVARDLSAGLAGVGATALPRRAWLATVRQGIHDDLRIGLVVILGMAGVYTAIAIVNTLVMAVRERIRDLAQVRLVGATRRQAHRMLLWEGGLVAAVGIGLGAAVTAITATALPLALRRMSAAAEVDVPWATLLALAALCLALVMGTSLAAGSAALRHRPLEGLAVPE
jgi:putative ABC transport system permease protein